MKTRLFLVAATIGLLAFMGGGIYMKHVSQASIYSAGDESEAPQLQIPLEETTELRKQLMAEIKERNSDYLRDIFERYIDLVGANGIIDSLHEINPTCHDIAHDLGKVIYAKLQSVGGALRTCQNACFSGCMHGVLMERFTITDVEPHEHDEPVVEDHVHIKLKDVRDQIDGICNSEEIQDAYPYGDCIHGVGHALMYLAKYDVEDSLSLCDSFELDAERYYCATGAYMEYIGRKDLGELGKVSKYHPCEENRYAGACFRYKVSHVMNRNYDSGKKLGHLIQDCFDMPTQRARLGCFHGLGNAHGPVIAKGLVTAPLVCGQGTEDDQFMCIEGVIERMSKYDPEGAKAVCDTFEGWQHKVCETARTGGLYDMDKDFSLYVN